MLNPTYHKVLEGAQLARENNIDLILAIDGGSVIDCSKAIAMAAVSDNISEALMKNMIANLPIAINFVTNRDIQSGAVTGNCQFLQYISRKLSKINNTGNLWNFS